MNGPLYEHCERGRPFNLRFSPFPGVHSVAYAFPEVRIITTALDRGINDKFHILPGIGKTPPISSDQFITHFKVLGGSCY